MRVLSVSVPLPTSDDPNTMAPLARQHESLRQAGIDLQAFEIRGAPKTKYLTSLRRLHKQVEQVDLVHAHYGYAGWLARAQLSKPLVVSFMGSDLLGKPRDGGGITFTSAAIVHADRLFARLADAVIVKSAEMAGIIHPVSSHVIPNGVDLDEFRPVLRAQARAELGWDTTATKVLFAGNPSNRRKGYQLARDAVDRYSAETGEVVELVALHGVDAVTVPAFMNACDAMIMASIFEGSPNVVKEAMACDLPIVSVPVGDVEFLFEGAVGYTIVERNPCALGEGLRRTLHDIEQVAGRDALVAKGLDIATVAHRIIDVYESVLRP